MLKSTYAAMDLKHIDILRKLQPMIVRDLDIDDIIDELISKTIISVPLWDEIKGEQTSDSKNRKLLNNLPRRGPRAYSIFKESLRRDYSWISEEMDTLENTEDCVDSLDAPLGPNTPHTHLPANPPLSVKRTLKMEKLRQGLAELKPGSYLVLHALRGYGKSTLASATLQDKELIAGLFQNEIYWIKFGQRQSISETILMQLNLLFHQVRNLDPLSEPTSEDSLKYSLKRHFSKHNQALIILDDVNSLEIIEAFDFGCKTLVLTTDVDILQGRQNYVIEMSDGFSANESLDLFATAIGITVSELPKQARQIHDECKGMPLMISLFSAQFKGIKESLVNGQTSNEIWSYYLNALREKRTDVFQESLERQAATFDLCIDKLSTEDQDYYKTLAIFPEDVNISTKTLSIYWGQELAEVNSRMWGFCKKSLACRKWHSCLETYVYGVHNLALSHLRNKLPASELEKLHETWVFKNLDSCKSDFSKLPEDNYVYSYIGYHMEKANLISKFSQLYLNFGFIESKVFHIGPGDLLIDIKKYRNYITSGKISIFEKVADLEKFLIQQASTLAEYRRRNCLDLVQVALKHPFNNFIRKTAEILARERKERLYLNHLKYNIEDLDAYSEELHLQVRCVSFLNESDEILVGNDQGKVILWNFGCRQHISFSGNNKKMPIIKIVAPQNEGFFISISGDGKAKLFGIRRDFNNQNNELNKPLHPRAKQPGWINMSEAECTQDDSRCTFHISEEKILDIAFCKDGKQIAGSTDAGTIAIWDYDGRFLVKPQTVVSPSPITSIAFSKCGLLLHAVNSSTGGLLVLKASNVQYKSQFSFHPEKDKILSLLSVPQYNNLLIVLMETKLHRLSWPLDNDLLRGPHSTQFAKLADKSNAYTCASVTKDGKYIVTGDTGGSVNVCQIHDELKIVKTYKNFISSIDTFLLEDNSSHIICGGNRDTLVPMVHKWKFDPKEKKPVVRRLSLFDATMETEERNVVAVATSNGTVQIIQNDDVIAETPLIIDEKITSLFIFDNGNNVVYSNDNGNVYLFDIKLNQCKEILELSKFPNFMTVLNIDNEDVIVCDEGGDNLQIWKNPEDILLVEHTGSVILCSIIKSVKKILTVSETVVKIWDQKSWKLQSKYEVRTFERKISCSSLSKKQNYISLSNLNGDLKILKIIPKENLNSIKFQEFMEHKFNEGITAANFSKNEQFLALGFKSGEISIISIQSKSVFKRLQLHRREVRGLYWGPEDLDEPILLSLANELAWWKIAIKIKTETSLSSSAASAQREMSHSLNELMINSSSDCKKIAEKSSSGIMRTSKSLELGATQKMENLRSIRYDDDVFSTDNSRSQSRAFSFSNSNSNSSSQNDLAQSLLALNNDNDNENEVLKFWNQKLPKYSKIDGLLSVVKLDGDLAKKICISNDFSHFLTLNGEGAIYNLRILDSDDSNLKNDEEISYADT